LNDLPGLATGSESAKRLRISKPCPTTATIAGKKRALGLRSKLHSVRFAVKIKVECSDYSLDPMNQSSSQIDPVVAKPIAPGAISLVCMFQIVTACCIFFACLRISPLLAIVGTIIATPAIIRTTLASDLHRKSGIRFSLKRRVRVFVESIGVVLLTLMFSSTVFALVSLGFGLICVVISVFLGTASDLLSEIAFIGTVGGTVWGATGAILAMGLCAQTWRPTLGAEKLDTNKVTTMA
jgi:hypothetical protein